MKEFKQETDLDVFHGWFSGLETGRVLLFGGHGRHLKLVVTTEASRSSAILPHFDQGVYAQGLDTVFKMTHAGMTSLDRLSSQI